MFATKLARRFTLAAVGLLIAGTAVLSAQQGQPAGPPGERPGRGPMAMGRGPAGPLGAIGVALRQLDLTQGQRDQIKAIMESHKDEMKAIGERRRELRKAVEAAITADTVDASAIRNAHAELAQAMADGAVLRATIRHEVMQILTPEQKAKAETLKQLFETRRKVRAEQWRQRMQARPRPVQPPAEF
jgi:protein CpxP